MCDATEARASGGVLGKRPLGTIIGMKNAITSAALAAGLFLLAIPAAAQMYIYVSAAPPAPMVETIPASPGAGYAWVGGYYKWNGSRYVWVHGHYARHAGRWCEGHWHHGAHGYYWTEGKWC